MGQIPSARPDSLRQTPIAATLALAVAATAMLGGCALNGTGPQLNRTPSIHVAEAALTSGAPDVALHVADMILAKNPKDAAALTTRGDALYALGQRGKAGDAYRAAVAVDTTSVGAQIGLGRTLASSDPAEAEKLFLAALALEPDNLIALNNLGVVRDLQGRNDEAQAAYRQALDLAPGSSEVQINLGLSLAVSGRKAEAVQVLRPVAAAMPAAGQTLNRQLVAALDIAGDGAWAKKLRGYPAGPAPWSYPVAPVAVAQAPAPRIPSIAALPSQAVGIAGLPPVTGAARSAAVIVPAIATVAQGLSDWGATPSVAPVDAHSARVVASMPAGTSAPAFAGSNPVESAPGAPTPTVIAEAATVPRDLIGSAMGTAGLARAVTEAMDDAEPAEGSSDPLPTPAVPRLPPASVPPSMPSSMSSGVGPGADIVAMASPAWPLPTESEIVKPGARHPSRSVKQAVPISASVTVPLPASQAVPVAATPAAAASFANLGAFKSGEDAIAAWVTLTQLNATVLIGHEPRVTLVTTKGHPAWWLHAIDFVAPAAAEQFCADLRIIGQTCSTGSSL
jgi:Flp pilus assembly protein TadD